MKKAPTATEVTMSACPQSSADPTTTGRFPKRVNTVLAQTLADLLAGLRMTGMDAVFDASTTRLAHHVHALGRYHGWLIESAAKVVGTSDGRVQTVSEYFMAPELIEAAFKQGAREWIAKVRSARRERRRKAAEARRDADRANAAAAARRRAQSGQCDLFTGAAA